MNKTFIVSIVVFAHLLFFAGVFSVASYYFSPASKVSKQVSVVVPKGASATVIGKMLQEKGLVHSDLVFRISVWKQRIGNSLQAGTFVLDAANTPDEIARALTRGTNDVWVTLVEGWRNEEVSEELRAALGETFDEKAFLNDTRKEQGFLFPDTYLFSKEATSGSVLRVLRSTFDKKVTQEIRDGITKQGLLLQEGVTMASLIEREARKAETMRMVAGILLKRLQAGWPLQVDATLQYIHGYDAKEKTWWTNPTAAEKSLKSPYNTYSNPGLPPGPIANPGLNALKAVANPTPSEYWYYITDPQGVMHYAKTIEEHNANVQKYL